MGGIGVDGKWAAFDRVDIQVDPTCIEAKIGIPGEDRTVVGVVAHVQIDVGALAYLVAHSGNVARPCTPHVAPA